ncbi:FkbM family methyltransferase [Actinokineospora guangxiensis]|uniref:FkbM family methyltransferase n=1 Tax=Actinokineospora guangxiensis TaxID=1490288 RepID=A0ABW0EGS2_9PSEU
MATQLLDRVPPTLRTLAKRTALRFGFDVTRHPFSTRLARLCADRGITAVLDVGANSGQYAQMLRQAGFRGRIVSCEPVADAHHRLARAAAADPDWEAERVALGAAAGEVEIHVAGNSYSSSVLPMLDSHLRAAPESAYVRTETAPMSTVDALMACRGLRPAETLLKIDVQGFEGAVLAGARDALPVLAAAQVELSLVPLYEGQQLIGDIVERMAEAGMCLWGLEPGFCDAADGRMLQCDGLFVRSDS